MNKMLTLRDVVRVVRDSATRKEAAERLGVSEVYLELLVGSDGFQELSLTLGGEVLRPPPCEARSAPVTALGEKDKPSEGRQQTGGTQVLSGMPSFLPGIGDLPPC